jgi:lysine biosynthesis protein LysW
MTKADCPSCEAKVNVGSSPKMGKRVVCPVCHTELEIVWLDPVELDWPYDDDEDEYDEYEDSDYDD